MKRILSLTIALWALPSPAWAYIDHLSNFTLGYVVNQSTHIAVMQVAKVSKEKGVIIYKKVADGEGLLDKNEFEPRIRSSKERLQALEDEAGAQADQATQE